MAYKYETLFFSKDEIEGRKLAEKLESGWELVSVAPFQMAPEDGTTVVKKYLIALRQPKE